MAILAAGLLATAGLAATAPGPNLSPQEAADQKLVKAALAAPNFEALARHVPALRTVYEHAPASYPMVLEQGDVTVIHADDQDTANTLMLLVTAATNNRRMSVVYSVNTYPMAAFLLTTYANEMKRPAEALTYLDRGLAMQPENAHLISEKAAALFVLKRPREALPMIDTWLEQNPLGGDRNRARLLRSKGFALVEIGDLDGAAAAYRKSLELEPGHKGARYELDYITKLKAGGEKLGGEITTGDKARNEDVKPHPAGQTPKP